MFEVLDARSGPLFGRNRVTLAGPFATRIQAECEATLWRGATDPRVVEIGSSDLRRNDEPSALRRSFS